MRDVIKTLVLSGCLLLWAGADDAKAVKDLKCSQTSCTYPEEFGPNQIKYFHGTCPGTSTALTSKNSNMVCHKAEFLTCTPGQLWNSGESDAYWKCSCDNWSDKNRANTTIDLSCP